MAEKKKTTGTVKEPTPMPSMFNKENYLWMGIGIAVMAIGFILMAGGKSPDPNQFLRDEVYSFRRITLAPILILIGFVIEIYAIFKKPKDQLVNEKI
jgi:hypothetical protein